MLLIATIVFALILIIIKVLSKLSLGRCSSPVCLIGKTALITGGNSGIGYQTALALAGRGCRIIIADRDNCDKSKDKIIRETGNSNIAVKYFDLASLSSVRKLAKDINETEERLDILINNAGTGGLGNGSTEDGLHIGMQVNHFGSFLLTHLLVGLLKKSAPSRIIFVSSFAAFVGNYDCTIEKLNISKEQPSTLLSEFMVYANSKLCNVITANGFAQKLKHTGVTSNSLHPGIVHTPIYKIYSDSIGKVVGRNKILTELHNFLLQCILYIISKNPQEGAQTTIHLALSKELENVTGKYFIDCRRFLMPSRAKEREFSRTIWQVSEDFVKLAPEEKL